MLNLKILYFGQKRLGRDVDPKTFRIVPTPLIVLALAFGLVTLGYEVYLWTRLDDLPLIEVGDAIYYRGEEGYDLALARLKSILSGLLWISGLFSLFLGVSLFFRCRRADHGNS
jgi:hypothetical protein